ncbi:proprotein convertase P-domain-containing protein [Streptomyces sp. SA15]|uniref:proprotein convertase P-domain-containing protein n=1 Tax=Streptomyces sp. SA15 TaxID=934019 RepID=UPI00211C13A0|nr:proprotein convertase P-domain-containing protein [Streptomyces sp. SA15]
MRRRIYTGVIAVAAAMVATAFPAPIPLGFGPQTASASTNGPVDPPLFDQTQDGKPVRVNVVTDQREDVAGAAEAGTVLTTFDYLPVVTLEVTQAGLTDLQSQPGVVSVTEDVPLPPSLTETTAKIGSDTAAIAGKTGTGATVAVLDTGVEAGHAFLGGRVTDQACFSVNNVELGVSSLCPNGQEAQEGTGAADTAQSACASLSGACDHGTHVAGIAAGNGQGVAGAPLRGVAPGANIAAVQVFSLFDNDAYCGAGGSPCVLSYSSSQMKGLEKVLAWKSAGKPIVAANMSLGAGRFTAPCDLDPRKGIVDRLWSANVATVIAAGNNGHTDAVAAPGCVSSAVTVGSTSDDDQLSAFSNRGTLLDLLAPGNAVTSSVSGGAFAAKNGTSMAAPHVAGALAVLKQTYPTEGIDSLVSLLATSGTPISYTGATTPRIDVGKAVQAIAPKPEADKKPRAFQVDNDKRTPIPDGVGSPAPGAPAESPVTVSEYPGKASKKTQVFVNITHTYRGDLKLELVAPSGTVYLLKDVSGTDAADNVVATYTVDAAGQDANGTWKLRATDHDDLDTGKINTWSLIFPTPFESTALQAIPDTGTIVSTLDVDGIDGRAAGPTQVWVNLTHAKIGNLRLTLDSPDGKVYTLKPYGAEPGGTLTTTYGVDATAAVANGTWKLKVTDGATGSTGELKGWSLGFPSYENQTQMAIPDATGTYVELWTKADGLVGSASNQLQVYVDASHQYLANLKIDLVAPDGSVHLLQASGQITRAGDLKKIYTVDASAFPANGWWKLRVDDVLAGNTGTVNNFVVRF